MARKLCVSCAARESVYVCPVCNAPLCSLACYKGHNSDCTESFYQKQVDEYGRLNRALDADGTASIEPLARAVLTTAGSSTQEPIETENDGEDGEDATVTALRASIERAAIEGTLQDSLPEDVLRQFEQTVARGNVADFAAGAAVAQWMPWWHDTEDRHGQGSGPAVVACVHQRVAPLPSLAQLKGQGSQGSTRSGAHSSGGPASSMPSGDAPAQASLGVPNAAATAGSASPLLKNNIVDVLLAYVHTQRLYAGACKEPDCVMEAAGALLSLSGVLGSDMRHPSAAAALNYVETAGMEPWLQLSMATASTSGSNTLDGGSSAYPASVNLRDSPFTPSAYHGSTLPPRVAVGIALLTDLLAILKQPHYIVDALLDVHALLEAATCTGARVASAALPNESAGGHSGVPPHSLHDKHTLRVIKGAERKAYFLACWANDVFIRREVDMSSFDRIAAGLASGAEVLAEVVAGVQQYLAERLQVYQSAPALGKMTSKGTMAAKIEVLHRS